MALSSFMKALLSAFIPGNWGAEFAERNMDRVAAEMLDFAPQKTIPCGSQSAGPGQARIMFNVMKQDVNNDTAHIRIYNKTSNPIQMYVYMGVLLRRVNTLEPWSSQYLEVKLEIPFEMGIGSTCRLNMDHKVLRKYSSFRVEIVPQDEPWGSPWWSADDRDNSPDTAAVRCNGHWLEVFSPNPPFEPYSIGPEDMSTSSVICLIHRGEHETVAMDPLLWSTVPNEVVYKILSYVPSDFGRTECGRVCNLDLPRLKGGHMLEKKRSESWVVVKRGTDFYSWCPRTGMVFKVNAPCINLRRIYDQYFTIKTVKEFTWLQSMVKATLVVDIGTQTHAVHLQVWGFSYETCSLKDPWPHIRLSFDFEPQGEEGELCVLDCSRGMKPILVAALLVHAQVQWIGIWELNQDSSYWTKLGRFKPFEVANLTGFKVHFQKNLVIINNCNKALQAFHLPSRTLKRWGPFARPGRTAFDSSADPELAYFDGMEASLTSFLRMARFNYLHEGFVHHFHEKDSHCILPWWCKATSYEASDV